MTGLVTVTHGIWNERRCCGKGYQSLHGTVTRLVCCQHFTVVTSTWLLAGVVIDVSQAISEANETNFAIPVSELEAWESRHGVIPDGALVFIRTGWGAKSHDLAEYSGIDSQRRNNFPGE
uniref:Uncharacterized protein n=1 Tax=Scylla olivacea TaxID=85551 RepID=A0A0P4VVY8_SCYOL